MSSFLLHAFQSLAADGPDATKLRPSNWNADHVFSGGVNGAILYKDSTAVGGASWSTTGAFVATRTNTDGFPDAGGLVGALNAGLVGAYGASAHDVVAMSFHNFGAGIFARYDAHPELEIWIYNTTTSSYKAMCTFIASPLATVFQVRNYTNDASLEFVYGSTGGPIVAPENPSGSNVAGTDWRLLGGRSTGSGTPGQIIFGVVATPGSSGSSVNSASDVLAVAYTGLTPLNANYPLGTSALPWGNAFVKTVTAGYAVGIGTNTTDGAVIQNTSSATSGVTVQYSPRLRFSGTGYNSVSGLSETNDWYLQVQPNTAAGATGSNLFVGRMINGASLTGVGLDVSTDNQVSVLRRDMSGYGTVNALRYIFSGGTILGGPTDGLPLLTTSAGNVGVGFDVKTDAIFKVRTRAQTGYATVDCLGLKASGVAGATFGPAAVSSLTVVNGIVTAAS